MNQPVRIPAKTREVFEHLKICANQMRTVTYKEIADEFGLAKPGVGRPLGYIRDDICRARGLPWLSAIVVNTHTDRPGRSFMPEGMNLTEVDKELLWRGMVIQAFAFNWSHVDFDE